MRHVVLSFVLIGFFTLFSASSYGQVNAVSAKHETDAQNQIFVTLSGNLSAIYNCTALGNCNTWTVTIGGVDQTPTSVVGANGTSTVVITFTTPVGIDAVSHKGQTVTVTYTGGGAINNFGPLASVNARRIACTDFTAITYNDVSLSCAPVEPNSRMIFSVIPGARNSTNWDLSKTTGRVTWGSATSNSLIPDVETNSTGAPTTDTYFVTTDTNNDPSNFIYPIGAVCGYTSVWNVRLTYALVSQGFNGNCSSPQSIQTQVYASHNDDETGTGADVRMPPTAIRGDEVCVGSNVSMTFSDNTDLNCNPTTSPIPTNDKIRWVRVVYGSTDLGGGNTATDNIPNIRVDGVPVTDASGNLLFAGGYIPPTTPFGTPDAFGVVAVNAPVTAARGILNLITTSSPAGQVVGQRFWVRLEYWNTCNAYDGAGNIANNARFVENDIVILAKPAPPTAVNQEVCNATTPNPFQVNFPNTTTKFVNWYRDNAGVPGTSISSVNVNTAASATLTLTAAGFSATPLSGTYSVWASYTPGIAGSTNCETDKVKVDIIVRPVPAQPGVINGPTEVCNDNVTLYNFNETNPSATVTIPSGFPVGGPTEYRWTLEPATAGITITGSPGQSVNVRFNSVFAGASTTSPDIRVTSHYTTNTYSTVTCASTPQDKDITIYNPSLGGSISPTTQTICSGTAITNIEVTGLRGAIQGWERSVNGGAFGADGSLGVANPVTPVVSLVGGITTTYRFRAIIKNGECSSVFSPEAEVIVNPIPPKPTITPSGATTFCLGGSVTLNSSNVMATSYQWFKDGNPVGGATSSSLMLNTVAQSGVYTVQTFGVVPTNCAAPVSDPVTVTVNPLPTASNPTGGGAVCNGNAAPDIVWTLTGTAPFNVTYTMSPGGPVTVPGHNSTTFTIASPTPGVSTTYQITAITDANTCVATSMGGTASVTIGGNEPAFDIAPSLSISAACDDVGLTSDPQINFSLVDVDFASQTGFILNYQIDGVNKTAKLFNTDAAGTPTPGITFSDTELNSVGPHTIKLVSIISPATCQKIFNLDRSFTVNARPSTPVGAVNATACSDVIGAATVSVTDPDGAGPITIDWYAASSGGAALASGNNVFNPGAGDEPVPGATKTYFAEARNNTSTCTSTTRTAVTLTSDNKPAAAITAGAFNTCDPTAVLNATATAIGTGTWSLAGTLYNETFSTADNNMGVTGPAGHPATFSHPQGNWSMTLLPNALLAADDWLKVDNGAMSARDLNNNQAVWQSRVITIPGPVNISVQIAEFGNQVPGDFIRVFYKINGGAEIQFGQINGDGADGVFQTFGGTGLGLAGQTIQIIMRAQNDSQNDLLLLDNVVISSTGTSFPTISDANDPLATVANLSVGSNSFTWTVTSPLGVCASTNASTVITRHPLPVANDPAPLLCEDAAGGAIEVTVTLAYLNSLRGAITGIPGFTGRTVDFYTDVLRSIPFTVDALYETGDKVYTRVIRTDLVPNCPQDGEITFTVVASPVANTQTPSICEDIDPGTGFGFNFTDNVNLTSLNDAIKGGAGVLNRTITWYNDPGGLVDDPSDLTAPFLIAGAGDVDGVVNNQVFYALVQNDLTSCLNIAKVTYTIKNVPDPQTFSGDDPTCASAAPQLYTLPDLTTADSYVWNYPANIPGQFKRFGGGGLNEGFLLLQFPSLSSPPSSDNYLIRVAEVKNGCQGIFNEITITVEDTPSPNPIHPPGIVCKNSDGVTIQTESEFNGDPNNGNNYTWSVILGDAAIVGAAAGQNLDKVIVDFGSAPVVKIRVEEVSPTGCNGPPQEIAISTNDQPSMTSLSTAEICSDEFVEDVHILTANVTPFTPPNTPLHFDWQVASIAPPGSVSGIVVGNTGTATNNGEIGHALFNISGIIGTVVYNVTPVSDAGCRGDAKQLTLTVHPKPVLLASQNKTICSGSDVDYEIRLSPPNAPSTTVFNWGDPDLAGPASAGVNVPLGASGTLHITDNLINTGSLGSFDVVYNVIPSNPISGIKSCFGTAQNITITVNPEPVSTNPTNLSDICSDANVNYALQNSITNSVNSTFQWQSAVNDPDVTGESNSLRNTSTIDDVIINPSGTHQLISYNVTPTGTVAFGSCPGDPFTVNITVERKPVASPQLLTAICSSTTTAVGYVLQSAVTNSVASNFEWLVPVPNASVSGGATSLVTSNTITDVLRNTTSVQHSVIYSVTPKAQNDLQCPGTSFTVTVPVNPEPIGTTLSLPDFCSQGNVNYSLQPNVNANNSVPSSFEWRVLGPDDNALISGQSTSIQASATINNTLINVSGGNEQLTYTITPRSIAPANCLGADFKITVIVKPEPVGFAETLSTICSDNAPGYVIQTQNINTPPGNSVPSTFVWRPTVDNPDVIGDENLGNRTTATINETLVNTASLIAENVVYEILPTGTNGCAGEAFEITVPVGPKPVGTTVTAATVPPGIASPDICSQTTFTYDLQANINFTNPVPSNFTWSTSSDSFVDNEITTPTPGNAISNTLINVSQFSRTLTYIVHPVSVDGCPGDPFNVSVFVKNEPVGWNDITFPAICSQEDVGYDIQNVNLNTSPGNSLSSNFVWKVLGPDNNINIQNQSTSDNTNPTIDDDLVNRTATDQSLVYTVFPTGKAPNGCVGSPFRITVLVHPEPVGATANPGAVCSDVAHAINLQNLLVHPGVASEFTWRAVSDIGSVTGESLSNQVGDFINDAIKNETPLSVIVPYTVTAVSDIGSCEGSAFTVNVSTAPEPKGSAGIKTICSGDNVNYSLQNNINLNNALNSTFTWLAVGDIGDISGESLGNQFTATIGDVLGNNSNPGGSLDVTYQVTPVSGGCTGDNFNVVVSVSPRPIVPASIPEAVLCSGLPFSISLQSKVTNNVPSNFSWTAVYNGVLSGGLGSGSNTISETLSNLGGSQLNATYSVSVANAAAPFCTGTSFTLIKPIDPQPVTDPALAAVNICSDLPTGIQLNTNGISIGANAWDVDFISVTPNLTPNASNAVDPGLARAFDYIQNDRYTNTSSTLGFAEYMVTPVGPAANFCRGVQTLVRLEVRPEPVMNPALTASTVVCSDEAIGIVLSTNGTSVAAQSYIYSSLEDPPGTPVTTAPGNPPVSGSDRIASIIQNDKYTNVSPTGATLTRAYIVKPKSAANCLGNEIAIPVQVLPEPDFNFAALIPPVCSGVPINLALTAATATPIAKYQITNINWDVLPAPGLMPGGSNLATGITVTATGSGFTIPDIYTNGTSISLQAHYKVIPIATTVGAKTCVGNEKIATVDILPSPVVDADLDKIVCNDAVNGITITTEGTSAPAQSFEIVRTSLPAGLTAGVYATGTQVVNGLTTNNIAADHVINSTDNPLVATYAIRANTAAAGAGCYGPVENIRVTVEPQFRITLSGPPGNTNNTKPNICSADDTKIELVSPSNPTAGDVTFNFTAAAATPGTISGMSPGFNLNENDFIAQVLSNSSNNPVDVTYTVTPRANSAAGGTGCVGTASTTVVKVEPKPKMKATPTSLIVCEGVPLGLDLSSTTIPSTGAASMFFTHTSIEDLNTGTLPVNVTRLSPVNPIPHDYSAGTDVVNDVLKNDGVGQEFIRYNFTPSFTILSGTCLGDPVSVNITVNPRPVMVSVSPAPASVPFTIDPQCSAAPFSKIFSDYVTEADLSSTLVTWTYSYSSSDLTVKGASPGAGFELSQVVFNGTNAPITVTYSIKAKAFNCESNTIQVPVVIYPIPKITGLPQKVDVCDDASLNVPLNSTASNTLYTWEVDDQAQPQLSGATDRLLASAATGPLFFSALSNADDELHSYEFIITPQVNTSMGVACYGDPKQLLVNVAPPVGGDISTSQGAQSFICAGSSETILFEFEGNPNFKIGYIEGGIPKTREGQGPFFQITTKPSVTTVYTLVSVKDAFGCEAVLNKNATVNVFRKPSASFNEGTIPPFAGGALVNFTNTSTPLDFSEFRYEWAFGADSDPRFSSANSVIIPVNYKQAGLKDVTLTATNILAEAAGVTCLDSFEKTIEILLPPLVAAFTATPLAACFPVDIEVKTAISGADTYKWQVIDQSGRIAATALTKDPVFHIVNPGTYDVFLEASHSFTGQVAFAQQEGIEIFDNPVASLEARPTTLFIPDTELVTFNFSTGANFYEWDFDDGTVSEDFEPKHLYNVEGTYEVTLIAGYNHGEKDIDGDGVTDGEVICYDTARRQVIARQGGLTKLPNAFTPSKNGPSGGTSGSGTFNDVFLPITKGVAREDGAFVMQIFDRWGTLIFESRIQTKGWDGYDKNGNLVPAGVYVYKLDLRLADGQRTTQVGDVTVIR